MTGDVALPPGGRPVPEPVWDPWSPWEVQARLRGMSAPWYIAAGWALDLFRGEQTRQHGDIEIGVPNTSAAFRQVRRALAGCEFEVVGHGQAWPLDSPAFEIVHQTWVSEDGPDGPGGARSRIYRLDVFREPHRAGRWFCRRDETIVLPYEQIIRRGEAGVPYLAPELVLLFKARANRPKDERDFLGVLPLLASDERSWLATALRRLHPGHQWLDLL